MKYRVLPSLIAITVAAGASFAAAAQNEEQVISVYERSRPDYSTPGGRSGSFLLKPTLGVGGSYDSNIFAQESSEVDDFIVRIKPGFDLSSDWNNNFLSFFANADTGLYLDNTRENYTDFNIGTRGRLDISRGTSLSADVTYSDAHEDRGSPDNIGAQADQTTFSTFTANVGFLRDESLVSFAANAGYKSFSFDNPGLIDATGTESTTDFLNNRDRDREVYTGDVRLGYEVDEFYEAFIRLKANRVEYTDSTLDGGPNRNSDGYELVAGAAFDITGTSKGEFFGGYIKQEYDSNSLTNISDFTYGASLLWNPTGLTSVRGTINRTVVETVAADLNAVTGNLDQASGILGTSFDLQLEHELQRNVLLKATATYIKQDFQNTLRDDDLFNASLAASYLINRNLSFDASYKFNYRDTTAQGQDFKRHIFMVGIKAQW